MYVCMHVRARSTRFDNSDRSIFFFIFGAFYRRSLLSSFFSITFVSRWLFERSDCQQVDDSWLVDREFLATFVFL